jgi:hypothetical protein
MSRSLGSLTFKITGPALRGVQSKLLKLQTRVELGKEPKGGFRLIAMLGMNKKRYATVICA